MFSNFTRIEDFFALSEHFNDFIWEGQVENRNNASEKE